MRGIVGACLLAAAVAADFCGGNNTTLPLPSGGPSDVVRNGTASGTVIAYSTHTPISGAGVVLAGSVAVTDSAGRFTLNNVPSSGTAVLTANLSGYLFRGIGYAMAPSRTGLSVDLIQDALPFSLQFYRVFVRNAFEGLGNLQPTHPWTMAPSFYFKTTVETSGDIVPDSTIDAMVVNFRASVPDLSGGKFGVAAVERGPDARPITDGWVNVTFYADLGGVFGTSTVGGNSGTMSLRFGLVSTSATNPFNCSTPELGIADHEITHTMGYYHTPDVFNDTFSGNGCPGTRPDYVKYHATVMYSRPPGNIDPDVDPSSIANVTAPGGSRPVIKCALWGGR